MDRTDTITHVCSHPSEDGHTFDVFLSHSGKQKNFVRQLHRDLTDEGFSCFFDQDGESLPVAENFPSRIFEAAKTCEVAVLLLSKDFLESKWPMLELSAFVEARDKTFINPNLKILPLFFQISPHALKNITADNEKWQQLEKSTEKRAEWQEALDAIRPISGLSLGESGDELEFRDKIVKAIWQLLPTPSLRYHVHCMQGERRMCQELADFFNKVQPNKEGIRIAGLYGIAGQGKTTLGKAFCNFKMGEFEGKICHLEFSRGDAFKYMKLALKRLTHCSESHLQRLIDKEQAKVELHRRVKGQRVLLVLDNITEESKDEVTYYLKAEFGENSCILLSARSVDVLEKHFYIDSGSCMHVPRLEKKEAIQILLERTSIEESTLGTEDKAFAVNCAARCLFGKSTRTFHPLALKAFGGYLFTKYRLNLSKWVDEINGMVDRSGVGLDEVLVVLGQAFDNMRSEYRTIFMLLTVYKLPNLSPYKVTEWMAINCNQEISFIVKAVEDLQQKAFIEEIEPKIRIHDLYIEFARRKAKEMGKWLWWKGIQDITRGLIPQDNIAGFELAKLEQCMYRRIAPSYLRNLFVLQLVNVQNRSNLDLGPMERLRSVTLLDCKLLAALDGMEKLVDLAWLQIRGVHPMFRLPDLSSLEGSRHLEIDNAVSHGLNQLGDLTNCFSLREINVRCPSLSEFPRVNGLRFLKKVEFSLCDKVTGPLDCSECVELQSVVLDGFSQMTASPILTGCTKLSNIVLRKCDAVTSCPDMDVPSALKTLKLLTLSKAASSPRNLESCDELENHQLCNMGELKELPSFRSLSNLIVLVLYKCGITEPPDLTCCALLEDVSFCNLKNLLRFPNFSFARELKKLRLKECTMVQDPPDISGCHKMKVFHLVHNDNMEGLPEMGGLAQLEEIKLSWHSEDKVTNEAIDSDTSNVIGDGETVLGYCKYEDLQNLTGVSVPEALKELRLLKRGRMKVKRYFREAKLYYSIAASWRQKFVFNVIIQREGCEITFLKAAAGIEGGGQCCL